MKSLKCVGLVKTLVVSSVLLTSSAFAMSEYQVCKAVSTITYDAAVMKQEGAKQKDIIDSFKTRGPLYANAAESAAEIVFSFPQFTPEEMRKFAMQLCML